MENNTITNGINVNASTSNINLGTKPAAASFDVQRFSEDIFGADNGKTNTFSAPIFDMQNFAVTTDSNSAIISVKIGDNITSYTALSDISTINSTATVTLLTDTTVTTVIDLSNSNTNITLDLNGKTVSGSGNKSVWTFRKSKSICRGTFTGTVQLDSGKPDLFL